ncbi:MAG: YncE family protein [Thermoleophilia bacterium]|nr:YncE family protein [Thermoleophilia bacterium]
MLPMRALAGVAAVAVFITLTTTAEPRPLGGGERAFVAAEDDNQLVAVDIERGRVARIVARLRVPRGPHNVAAARASRSVLVTSPPAGRVTLVDAYTANARATFRGLRYPHDVEFHPRGRYAYVTEEQGDAVAVLDLLRRRVSFRVRVPERPHDLAVSPGGARVWVTHGARAGALTVLDTRRPDRPRVLRSTAVARAPHDITFACRGLRVWVTFWNSGIVGAYDARSGKLAFARKLGVLVHHVQSDYVGRDVWITDHVGARARLLAGCSGRLLRTLRVGHSPHHVGVGMFRGQVAVASHDGTLTVLDPPSKRVQRVEVGRGLHGVAIAAVP